MENKLKKLKKEIENINVINYIYEGVYNDLYNVTIDYMNDTQDFDFEYLFDDFVDYETAEEIAKNELERGGLIRLYYFLGNADLHNNLFKINGYGNLEDVTKEDIEFLKNSLLEEIKDKISQKD